MPIEPVHTLFFDLDGTLMDAGPGITRCIQHALETLGEEVPNSGSLVPYLGPPLWHSFRELLAHPTEHLIDSAISIYRERFNRVGMFENSVYPGVEDCLGALAQNGVRLFVVTSKPQVIAQRVTEHFDLARFFGKIYGPGLDDESSTKAGLIAEVLAAEEIPKHSVAMIGDRKYDVEGARANGVRAVGVTWGYGSREELIEAGAECLVESLEELLQHFS